MIFFDLFKGKKRKEEEKILQQNVAEYVEEGIEWKIKKRQEENEKEDNTKELKGEEYKPVIPYDKDLEDIKLNLSAKKTREEYFVFLEENCGQIVECNRQNENAKIEYQAVTEYLSDLQKIERLEDGERKIVEEAAKKIVDLTREREAYQKREIHTSNMRFRPLRNYENTLMEDLKRMRECEDYQKKIRNDMRQLEAEKSSLLHVYKDVNKRQKELKQIAIVTSAIVFSLFALFGVFLLGNEEAMKIPFIMTIVMAAVIAGYIFWEAYHNRYEHELTGKKINRAISLLNKVKIKYINNSSTLEYSYSKYNVENSMELEYLMKEYTKAKEQERTYQSNTERLDHYRNKLIDNLNIHGIKDSEIWLYQATALLEKLEFETMKQNLESRRERLKEKMDYNLQVKDSCYNNIHQVLTEKSDMREDVFSLFKKYQIQL